MNQIQALLFNYKSKIDQGIAEELEKRLVEVGEISPHLIPVLQAMKELSVGGKRLRAMLTILGYQITRASHVSPLQDENEIIRAGVAMELFHLGLLIQDDVMDRDEKRRGVLTIHNRYDDVHLGETIATLAGDFTFGWVIEIIASLDLSTGQIVGAMKVWGKYFTRVGYGQTLDSMAIADNETILKVLSIKSGEYSCVLPLLIGATLGEADKAVLEALEKYGMELGHIFQLRDDWLAEYGDTGKTGKPVGNDSREGKHSYVMMYGKEQTERAIKEHVEVAKQLAISLRGQSSQAQLMCSLVEWVGTREN